MSERSASGPADGAARRRPPAAAASPCGGFSLLEVLVAIVVLSIGALAVARGMGAALATGTDAGEQTRASALAVDRLEYLKSRPAAEVDDEPAERIDARGVPDSEGRYVRQVEVTDASEGARPNTKEITVRVEYQAGQRGTQEVEVHTILFVNDT